MREFFNWRSVVVALISTSVFWQCSGTRQLAVEDVRKNQAIRVYLRDGRIAEGLFIDREGDQISIISETDHRLHAFTAANLLRIEGSKKDYDLQANPISPAEVDKYKGSRNTWGHAIGGAVLGGLTGLVVGLPIWVLNGNPPPLFVSALGALSGSIYLIGKGVQKDHELAVEQVRLLRLREAELQNEVETEKQQLESIEKQKQELLEKLKKKQHSSQDHHDEDQ